MPELSVSKTYLHRHRRCGKRTRFYSADAVSRKGIKNLFKKLSTSVIFFKLWDNKGEAQPVVVVPVVRVVVVAVGYAAVVGVVVPRATTENARRTRRFFNPMLFCAGDALNMNVAQKQKAAKYAVENLPATISLATSIDNIHYTCPQTYGGCGG